MPMNAIERIAADERPQSDFAKRAFDLICVTLLLLALWPLMLLIALLVRCSSPGSIFFRQQRVGRDGRLFQMMKFRTMHVASGGPSVTAGNDRRITPVGRLLRKTKLDEWPQFFNVLRGDMSLVGPRPEVPEYVQHYTEEQRQVLRVRPGITGITQVTFRHEEALLAGRSDMETYYLTVIMPEKLRSDLEYVRRHSVMGDIGLLCRTVTALFAPEPNSE
jgi:lipopolysaccharide/colanic/teichoic acid biosynthesis glycosyltransferase